MKAILNIGRAPDNDKVYSSPDISSYHARIKRLGDGKYEVEDLNSSNGTYINGIRIKKSVMERGDKLRLSAHVEVDVPALFGEGKSAPLPKDMDYIKEFALLEARYKEYEAAKEAIRKQHSNKVLLIRAVIMIGAIAILTLMFQALGAGIGMVVGLLATAATTNMTPKEEYDELELTFRPNYRCPKCTRPLNAAWSLLYSYGTCQYCGAVYNPDFLPKKDK